MKIFEITYNAHGIRHHVYFLSDKRENYQNKRFYRNYTDCKEQNNNYVNIAEQGKIVESMAEFSF